MDKHPYNTDDITGNMYTDNILNHPNGNRLMERYLLTLIFKVQNAA
jgi:hypothetical protein